MSLGGIRRRLLRRREQGRGALQSDSMQQRSETEEAVVEAKEAAG